MADSASTLELCGQCWWLTTDPYTLAAKLVSRFRSIHIGRDNIADGLRAAQRGRTRVWCTKKSRACQLCGSREVVYRGSDSQYLLSDLSKKTLLAQPQGYRGILRFTVTSDSVIIDQGYVKNRLTSSTGMTKWEGPELILRHSQSTLQEINPTRPVISQRRVANIASTIALEAGKACLDTCVLKHQRCRITTLPLLPTRVLDVREFWNDSGPCIRLHSSGDGERGHYAALSYCWGGPQTITTTKIALHAHMKAIPLQACSQSIKDAVEVARGLHIQYLWIDALCIIQDATSDKLHEIERMGRIYKNATITISAANSSSATYGFLRPQRSPKIAQLSTGLTSQANGPGKGCPTEIISCKVWYNREPEHDHSAEPLSRRGWAFQEQVLSERILQYGSKGVTWHCLDTDRTVPILHNFVQYKPRSKASRPAILRRSAITKGQIEFQLWTEMIEDYSHRFLTDQRDRLLAIAGTASELHDRSGDTYLAELWQEDIIKQLGWRQDEGNAVSKGPISGLCSAPSWSWASVDGGVKFGARYRVPYPCPILAVTPDTEFRSCSIHVKHINSPFGDVNLGQLTLSARVVEGPHPLALQSSLVEQVRKELGIIHENALIGTSNPRQPDTLEVTLDQNSKTSAIHLSIDSRRVVNGNPFGLPTVWYLLLGTCYNNSPVGLILTRCEESRYRRIGYFQSRDPQRPPVRFNAYFSTLEKQDITIF
ncbi:uncharacterized protein PAC_05541 [Phialocephala subalpina]|uniref:Heterokaryon incompatibility domain-containing protein n=1 Tax=Phialocephala subalpina TaxID=576137 RepID=A0A1L7WSC6_9HELO|nr:uncharacterized protein PAC_05541 [Phialocephala subalpina]